MTTTIATKSDQEFQHTSNNPQAIHQHDTMAGPATKNKEAPKPLQYTTKAIKSVDADAFIFHCVATFNDVYKINRNMIVLKSPEDSTLTLINALILTPAGEKALLKLGKIKNIMRLGTNVNFYDGAAVEDKYYLSKFHCHRWAPGKLSSCPNLPIHKRLQKKAVLPHPDCKCFVFRSTAEPEAVLLLSREKGGSILITGDCLQHQVDNAFINPRAMAKLKMSGCLQDQVVVSKQWLKAMNPAPDKGTNESNNEAIHNTFQTMSKAKFHRFISTSGNTMLKDGAKENVVDAIQKAFAGAVA